MSVLTAEAQARLFEELRLNDSVHELLPEPDPHVEIVFFHGLQMEGSNPAHSFWRTWKMRSSEECWPTKLLPEILQDSTTKIRVRVLSVSYEAIPDVGRSGRGTDSSDECLIAECLIHDLILRTSANVGQRNRVPVILVGHDLGGILIKQFVIMVDEQAATLLDESDKAKVDKFLQNLKSVFFFATPHSGSKPIEEMAARINADERNQMLRLMKVLSKETARINSRFQAYRDGNSKRSRFTSHAVHPTHLTNEGGFKDVLVVPEGSARCGVNAFYPAGANHFSVCQPEDKKFTPLQMLTDAIKKEVAEASEVKDV